MPRKKKGFPYEIHPSPAKGEDGKNIVYAKPAKGLKMNISELDKFCHNNYALKREITDANAVKNSDVKLDGVD